jgi:phage portal protein BeeE
VTVLQQWVRRKALSVVRGVEVDSDEEFTGFYLGSWRGGETPLGADFEAYVDGLYKANGVVFACIGARLMPFSEARFQFQEMRGGRPGKLFGTPDLALLENPWPNGTTGELLARMEQDASLAGNFYATVVGEGADRRLWRMRPDHVRILSGVTQDDRGEWRFGSRPLAYFFDEPGEDRPPVMLSPDRVVHYSPVPDPLHPWRGMSWLTPLIRDVRADDMATRHKLKWYQNGAALKHVIRYPSDVLPENFDRYVAMFEEQHSGVDNAYRTLHIGGGADLTTVGTDMKADFRAVQAAGETRIAAAAGVGAVIARFSEGLAGSALNQGNYAAAKRQFGDMTLRPLWRSASAALQGVVPPPAGSRLWYDARDVEFLKEDQRDAAEILQVRAATIAALVQAGYTPESAVDAIEADDLTRLVHSGLYSVQLQDPSASSDGGGLPAR